MFSSRDGDGIVVARRAQVRGSLVMLSSTKATNRVEFMNRGLNASINIRRCVALKELAYVLRGGASQARSVQKKLKSIAGSSSKKVGSAC